MIYSVGFPDSWTSGKLNKKILEYLDRDDLVILDGTWAFPDRLSNLSIDCETLVVVSNVDPGGYYDIQDIHKYCNFENLKIVNNFTYPNWTFWGYYCSIYFRDYKGKDFPLNPINRFLCYNRKPYEHRVSLVKHIVDNGLSDKGIYTLGEGSEYSYTIPENTHIKNENVGGDVGIPNDINTLGDPKIWESCFVNVITETVEHSFWVSEKTFKPIIGKRPFLCQNTYVIDKLREWGFRTFDAYWDESDIKSSLDKICGLSDAEISDMHGDMMDDLEYNHQHFFGEFSAKNLSELDKIVLDISNESKI